MGSFEIMEARHSVRQYKDQAIEPEKRAELERLTEALNRQYGLHMMILLVSNPSWRITASLRASRIILL